MHRFVSLFVLSFLSSVLGGLGYGGVLFCKVCEGLYRRLEVLI